MMCTTDPQGLILNERAEDAQIYKGSVREPDCSDVCYAIMSRPVPLLIDPCFWIIPQVSSSSFARDANSLKRTGIKFRITWLFLSVEGGDAF